MFSKEESRLLRQDFWTSFGKSFPRKWLLYDTKIKGVAFKFHFDTKSALIALDLEDDLENRINCWEKLVALKSILQNDYVPDAIYEEEYYLENGKEISRLYLPLEQKVSIHNKNSWRVVMEFFNKNMALFEAFFRGVSGYNKKQLGFRFVNFVFYNSMCYKLSKGLLIFDIRRGVTFVCTCFVLIEL